MPHDAHYWARIRAMNEAYETGCPSHCEARARHLHWAARGPAVYAKAVAAGWC